MKPIPNWTRFELKIRIEGSVSQIFDLWTKPEGLERWFLRKARFQDPDGKKVESVNRIEAGDSFEWIWHNNDFVLRGSMLQVDKRGRVVFSFVEPTIVNIHLEKMGDGTLLSLVEESIPEDPNGKMHRYVSDKVTWAFWLTQLKCWIEHGILVNETDHSMAQFGTDIVVNL